ncbi:peptidoglycan recognition protein family protein, partial [Limosilactobacillus vaginalis]|uniref:peptidoglycan recognition protein family protein n=1 Tax=Limosilactobacillus vaginalis TaxID=1633 RepID=UPI001F09E28F
HDWYMFGDGGRIVTGPYKWQGSLYYFDPSSYLRVTNDYRVPAGSDRGYLLGSDGRALTGFQMWQGTRYYFDPSTYLLVKNGYFYNGGQLYWADNNGFVSRATLTNAINNYIVTSIGLNNHAQITYNYVIRQVTGSYSKTADGKPNMVVVHETANPNDSIQGEINYEKNNYNSAFVHAFVDNNNIIQISDTDREAWGAAYPANGRAVQFEQVEVYGKNAFAHELMNAAYYTAFIMKKYNMVPSLASNGHGTLWSHHYVSQFLGGTDYTDPDGYWSRNANRYFGTNYTMSDFAQLVEMYYNNL